MCALRVRTRCAAHTRRRRRRIAPPLDLLSRNRPGSTDCPHLVEDGLDLRLIHGLGDAGDVQAHQFRFGLQGQVEEDVAVAAILARARRRLSCAVEAPGSGGRVDDGDDG